MLKSLTSTHLLRRNTLLSKGNKFLSLGGAKARSDCRVKTSLKEPFFVQTS